METNVYESCENANTETAEACEASESPHNGTASAGRKSNRGMSLVEVVVALSIIVIFSICATSVALSSNLSVIRSSFAFKAASTCTDMQRCFEASSDEAEFQRLLNFANISYEVQDHTYTIDYPAYTITATAYDEYFTAKAVLKKKNRVLYQIEDFHVPGRIKTEPSDADPAENQGGGNGE